MQQGSRGVREGRHLCNQHFKSSCYKIFSGYFVLMDSNFFICHCAYIIHGPLVI